MRPLLARCYDMLGRLAGEQGETTTAWQLRETSKTIQRELGLIAWWDALVRPPPAAGERAPELRRHPRAPLAWPVTVDTGQRRLYLHTTNMSTVGAKVRSSEALEVGPRTSTSSVPTDVPWTCTPPCPEPTPTESCSPSTAWSTGNSSCR